MTVSEAKAIAVAYLEWSCINFERGELLIDDHFTIETETAFVFSWQHRDWVLHRRREARLAGNSPITIDKETAAPTSLTLDEWFALNARIKSGELKYLNERIV